jgi:hypothetical protein
LALNELRLYLAEIEGQSIFQNMLLRDLVRRLAVMSADPRSFVAAVFEGISLFLDHIDEHPSKGEYADAMRAAARRNADEFAAVLARDLTALPPDDAEAAG